MRDSAMSTTIFVTVSSASCDLLHHSSSGLKLALTTCGCWPRMCQCNMNSVLFGEGQARLVWISIEKGKKNKEKDRLTDLMAIFIAAQKNPDCPWHCGIAKDRKAWILVSSLSSWSSLESMSGVSKPWRTWSRRQVAWAVRPNPSTFGDVRQETGMLGRDSGPEMSSWSRTWVSIGSRASLPGKTVTSGWSETVTSPKKVLSPARP